MATKYEVLASLVKRDHEAWAWQNQDEGDGNHHVIIGILRIMHDYALPPAPNQSWDWEDVVEEIYDRIAEAFSVERFDDQPTEPTNRDLLEVIEDTLDIAKKSTSLVLNDHPTKGDDMPPELDIPDQH
ncbi:hypothetical protein Q7F20_07555 [Curtobacterium sp. A7_M15]|uniref:hypothetical protein n=1 Tax=Curtobacterium sp. A7_M15 TaxID=3065241 RepID=UPI002737DEEB|nr:hypothetical protein [Curtobacterium sp. A7_M15]MDP4333224.1 hypothetical protein [Curtobacterium sp. A7_M15]